MAHDAARRLHTRPVLVRGTGVMAMPATIRIEDETPRIECGDCGRTWSVAREHVSPGAVLRCPHCGGHFVPRLQDYLRLRRGAGARGNEGRAAGN
ncbi:MAG: hypothetical protein D6760_01995 [Deltaproteobacteria bacterium]|nr:MAG: hypothetical protein D6760_01995 [Deltaproteobacteria bacterium]